MTVIKKFFNKKSFLRSIGIIIFLFIIIFKIDLEKFYQIIRQINYRYLIASVLAFLVTSLLNPWRWQYILKRLNIEVTFARSYYMVFFSILLGLITPAKIGEMGVKLSFFLREKDLVKKALVGVILERILDVIFLLIFASLAILFFMNLLPYDFSLVALTILLLFAILVFFIPKKWFREFIKKIIYLVIPPRYRNFYDHLNYFYLSFRSIGIQGYLGLIFLTFISWLASFFIIYIFARGVGINISFIYFAMASAGASLVSLLPVSIAGLGTREATYIFLLAPFNFSIEKIVVFSLGSTLFVALLLTLTGLICWLIKPKDTAKIDK